MWSILMKRFLAVALVLAMLPVIAFAATETKDLPNGGYVVITTRGDNTLEYKEFYNKKGDLVIFESYNEDGNLWRRHYIEEDVEEYYSYNEDKSLSGYSKYYTDEKGQNVWENYLFSGMLDTRHYTQAKTGLSISETFDPWGWMRKYNVWGTDLNDASKWNDAYYFKDGTPLTKYVSYTDEKGVDNREEYENTGSGLKLVSYSKEYDDKDGFNVYEVYDREYRLTYKSYFDKKLDKSVSEEYKAGKLVKRTLSSALPGDNSKYLSQTYDPNGLLWDYQISYGEDVKDGDNVIFTKSVTESYDNAGNLIETSKFYYNEKGNQVNEAYSADGKMLYYNEYEDKVTDDGKNFWGRIDRDGWQTYYWLDYRNGAGQYISERYDHTGLTYRSLEGISDNDLDFTDVDHDGDGKVDKKYVYDKYGNLTKTYHYDYPWYPNNTTSTFGPRFRDAKPGLTDKWFMFTPLDLSQDGTNSYDLVASNMFLFGKVYVSVKGDEVVITYTTVNKGRGNQMIESEYLNLLPDLASVTSVNKSDLGEGFRFGHPISIQNDLGGDTKVLMFVNNIVTFRNPIVDWGQELTRFYPNLPHLVELRNQMESIMD